MLEIIEKKKKKEELSLSEIEYVIDNYVNGNIPDYQMSAFLMAILLNGMTDEETINLTNVMKNSGIVLDLSDIDGIRADKHSTGGVGDKTTLILAPLVATTGVKVAKMSGRGLGHTGGTIDKLESIGGFNTSISIKQMVKQVNEIGVAVISQTDNIDPADKLLYSLRDVTGTVDSIPLIASSIMSKKLALGDDIIVVDVKVGNGALMKNIDDARKLANLMYKIGKANNKKMACILTNMNEPLGNMIGNATEVLESIDVLKGGGPCDLRNLVLTLGSYMVSLGKNIDLDEARSILKDNLNNGLAYNKFRDMVKYQKGNIDDIKVSDNIISVKSKKRGYIKNIDTLSLGEIARSLGAGRLKKDDEIDYSVGIYVNKKVGDHVEVGEELAKLYVNSEYDVNEVIKCFEIRKIRCKKNPLIYEIIM